ncbi:MAG: DUF3108 domain-containing protein [Alphaproteobacteria bacterium]|nr:DUF3108 domain-containing protein [Alphaproteobacteria bacterium]
MALYKGYWAGLPAARIRVALHEDDGRYRSEIDISSEGLPHLVTQFRAHAFSEGRLIADRYPAPMQYNAVYDLRKRRDRHLSMRFVAHGGSVIAERGPDDTSRKPPLAEQFRRNVLDPITVLTLVRRQLRRGARKDFTIPVYDGARRFDVEAHFLPTRNTKPGTLDLDLTLRPIAGFKGETAEEGDRDPDDSPRTVALTISDDAHLVPLSLTVPVAYLPLVVQFDRFCTGAPCPAD